MSNSNISIDGTILLYNNTELGGRATEATAYDSAVITNTATLCSITMFDSSVFQGLAETAIFSGTTTNSGSVIDTAFFNDNSVNIGSIGAATFTGTSENSGTVGWATFQAGSVNVGEILFNALFLSGSTNGGNVVGLATFESGATNTGTTGVSSVYVDFAAWLAQNVGINIAQDGYWYVNNINYSYSSRAAAYAALVSTPKSGAYSDGYYVDGTKNEGYVNPVPQLAQDAYVWYVYNYATISTADGNYSNGHYSNGVKNLNYNSPNNTPEIAQDDTLGYIYADGVTPTIANGSYSNFTFINGYVQTAYDNNTPAEVLDVPGWFVYSAAAGGAGSTANGNYSNGHYSNGVKSTTYNGDQYSNPELAQDDGLYYVYVNGVPTAANGAYRNGWYESGTKNNAVYIAPTFVINNNDGKYYEVAYGVTALANGPYTNGYYTNGVPNTTHYSAHGTPENAKDIPDPNGAYFIYLSGGISPQPASGLYSIGYFYVDNGGRIDINYNVQLPDSDVQDQYQTPPVSYVYTNGIGSLASGYYSTGYYSGGIATTPAETGLHFSIDDSKLRDYIAPNNQPLYTGTHESLYYYEGLAANGPYSNGYYASGLIDETYSNTTPQEASDDGHWYTYAAGVATAANGPYSNGYYASGIFNTSYSNQTPQEATDDGHWYTYEAGVATAANGPYSNGYYNTGVIQSNYNNAALPPSQALDQPGTYLRYVNGLVVGYWTNPANKDYVNNLEDSSRYLSYGSNGVITALNGWSVAYSWNANTSSYTTTPAEYFINGYITNLDSSGNSYYNSSCDVMDGTQVVHAQGSYELYNGVFYQGGIPYNGTMTSSCLKVKESTSSGTIYGTWHIEDTFIEGVVVPGSGPGAHQEYWS